MRMSEFQQLERRLGERLPTLPVPALAALEAAVTLQRARRAAIAAGVPLTDRDPDPASRLLDQLLDRAEFLNWSGQVRPQPSPRPEDLAGGREEVTPEQI